MPQNTRPQVPLERVVTYRGADVPSSYVPMWWEVVIRRGQVFFRWYNETSEMPIDAQYLEMRWLKTSTNCWKVVPTPTRMACLFYDLAFLILPAWENEVLPNYSKRERKNWSYFGVTAEGDLGNRCYKLVVEIAQLMRERLGSERLHNLDPLNCESAGDVLEGIMGLQAMGYNWDPTFIVSDVSIAVHHLWNTPQLQNQWDMRTVAAAMYDLMNLYSMDEDRLYRIHVANLAKQIGIKLTIGCVVGFRCASIVYSFV